jgi:hypothetical protein
MANTSLSDILTAVKNIVTALNNAAQTYLNVQGQQNKAAITAATLVKNGSGRVATVSVIVAGSATGNIYDSSSTTVTSSPIFIIPTTVGITVVNIPVSIGIVVAPGSGQTVTISYS